MHTDRNLPFSEEAPLLDIFMGDTATAAAIARATGMAFHNLSAHVSMGGVQDVQRAAQQLGNTGDAVQPARLNELARQVFAHQGPHRRLRLFIEEVARGSHKVEPGVRLKVFESYLLGRIRNGMKHARIRNQTYIKRIKRGGTDEAPVFQYEFIDPTKSEHRGVDMTFGSRASRGVIENVVTLKFSCWEHNFSADFTLDVVVGTPFEFSDDTATFKEIRHRSSGDMTLGLSLDQSIPDQKFLTPQTLKMKLNLTQNSSILDINQSAMDVLTARALHKLEGFLEFGNERQDGPIDVEEVTRFVEQRLGRLQKTGKPTSTRDLLPFAEDFKAKKLTDWPDSHFTRTFNTYVLEPQPLKLELVNLTPKDNNAIGLLVAYPNGGRWTNGGRLHFMDTSEAPFRLECGASAPWVIWNSLNEYQREEVLDRNDIPDMRSRRDDFFVEAHALHIKAIAQSVLLKGITPHTTDEERLTNLKVVGARCELINALLLDSPLHTALTSRCVPEGWNHTRYTTVIKFIPFTRDGQVDVKLMVDIRVAHYRNQGEHLLLGEWLSLPLLTLEFLLPDMTEFVNTVLTEFPKLQVDAIPKAPLI